MQGQGLPKQTMRERGALKPPPSTAEGLGVVGQGVRAGAV